MSDKKNNNSTLIAILAMIITGLITLTALVITGETMSLLGLLVIYYILGLIAINE